MSRSHMMVVRRRSPGARLRQTVVGCCLAWWSRGGHRCAVPAAAEAAAGPGTPGRRPRSTGSRDSGTRPLLCRPEPPDYPGCSPEQVRPLLRARFAAEYTGHAPGYRFHRMGQHRRGVIFAHLTPALNAKLARLYRAAVVRYAAEHTSLVTDAEGVQQSWSPIPASGPGPGSRRTRPPSATGTR